MGSSSPPEPKRNQETAPKAELVALITVDPTRVPSKADIIRPKGLVHVKLPSVPAPDPSAPDRLGRDG